MPGRPQTGDGPHEEVQIVGTLLLLVRTLLLLSGTLRLCFGVLLLPVVFPPKGKHHRLQGFTVVG